MNNITKERIDEVFLAATKHNLLDLTNQCAEALKQLPDEYKNNPISSNIVVASIVQGNVMAALQEVFYEFFTD